MKAVKVIKLGNTGLLLLAAAFLLGGCASYNSQTSSLVSAWESGDYVTAAEKARKEAEKRIDNEKDGLVWNLESGAILRGAGEFNLSLDSFIVAEDWVQKAEAGAKTEISNEGVALATNLAQLPYRGYFYDRIMLNTYQAMNYMVLGDMDAARVELNRASERQRDALTENAKRIEKAEEEARKVEEVQLEDGTSYVEKAKEDEAFQENFDSVYKADDGVALYADYVNPFTVFIDGLFFLSNPHSASDLERARKSFERVAQMSQSNQYLKEDLALVNQAAVGKQAHNLTYVIFETGTAPFRKEIRIDIPVFLVSDEVPYVGAAFPRLAYNDDYLSHLDVEVEDSKLKTETICNMDSVVKTEFYNELPIVITKTLVAAGTKALASYAVSEATDNSIWAQVATSVYQLAMNKADLRAWRSLPKEFQYSRFETPEAGLITIRNSISGESLDINLEANNINVVYVRCTGSSAPLSVHQFTMRPRRDVAADLQAETTSPENIDSLAEL